MSLKGRPEFKFEQDCAPECVPLLSQRLIYGLIRWHVRCGRSTSSSSADFLQRQREALIAEARKRGYLSYELDLLDPPMCSLCKARVSTRLIGRRGFCSRPLCRAQASRFAKAVATQRDATRGEWAPFFAGRKRSRENRCPTSRSARAEMSPRILLRVQDSERRGPWHSVSRELYDTRRWFTRVSRILPDITVDANMWPGGLLCGFTIAALEQPEIANFIHEMPYYQQTVWLVMLPPAAVRDGQSGWQSLYDAKSIIAMEAWL